MGFAPLRSGLEFTPIGTISFKNPVVAYILSDEKVIISPYNGLAEGAPVTLPGTRNSFKNLRKKVLVIRLNNLFKNFS